LLDTLDNNVGDAVEDKVELYDDVAHGVGGESSVDDILAKRGLLDNDEEDIIEDEESNKNSSDLDEETEEIGTGTESVGLDGVGLSEAESGPQKSEALDSNVEKNHDIITDQSDACPPHNNITEVDSKEEEGEDKESTVGPKRVIDDSIVDEEPITVRDKVKPNTEEKNTVERNGQYAKRSHDVSTQNDSALREALSKQKKLTKILSLEADAANKESRKLRRNVVKLNADLDAMERELEAQRTELERAAVRMEKDRQLIR